MVDGNFAAKRRTRGLTLVTLMTAMEKATEVVLFTLGGLFNSGGLC